MQALYIITPVVAPARVQYKVPTSVSPVAPVGNPPHLQQNLFHFHCNSTATDMDSKTYSSVFFVLLLVSAAKAEDCGLEVPSFTTFDYEAVSYSKSSFAIKN